MLTQEQKNEFSEILEELGNSLDISETQYKIVVKSYEAVGNWLSKADSSLAPYKPEILPQGSFMLGTMIKPINEKDDLDIDLVCQLKGKRPDWTQYDLKNKVGDRLKDHDTYKEMLDEEGRRCWTLVYSDEANYHMDILPSIVSNDYRLILERTFASITLNDVELLAIRLTCKEELNYTTATNPAEWLEGNPFGYGKWFLYQASLDVRKAQWILESVQPIPTYRKEKLPLQRVVQILKRHRDMLFNGHGHKPISVIITTLAGKAYNKETNIIEALLNVINQMPLLIEERYSTKHGKVIKWISNPVNESENFADRWVAEPQREENFYKWMRQVKLDIENAIGEIGLPLISESLKKPFGNDLIVKAMGNYAINQLKKRERGELKMAAGTGMLGSIGRTTVPQHRPFGADE